MRFDSPRKGYEESYSGRRSVRTLFSSVPSVDSASSVQLRPTVKRMGKVLEYDVSLLERLYTKVDSPQMSKTMLKVEPL